MQCCRLGYLFIDLVLIEKIYLRGSMIIGIDLGTSNSVCAYMSDKGPEIIPNSLERALTPSIIGVDKCGTIVVGDEAKEMQMVSPERCSSHFKRYMGESRKLKLADKEFLPEELSSIILKSLKEDAEAFLKEEVTGAVITVPAYFNDDQRKATIRAGEMAGLKVERIINEPTAASLAYGLNEEEDEKCLLVFDLGGGTFDVSIVEIFEGSIEVQASSGEAFLGGQDFTMALASKVLQLKGMSLERMEMKELERLSRLIDQCERAKKLLVRETEAIVIIPDEEANITDSCEKVIVDRTFMAECTEHILKRIENPLKRCLGDCSLSPVDIDDIILVGGATRMLSVVDRVKNLMKHEPLSRFNPDLVVAMGAAVQAGLISKNEALEDLVVTDVAPFTLGIETAKSLGDDYKSGYFMPIINRNTTIPTSRVERVGTISHNQSQIEVKVYQGEARKVADNLFLGSFTVKGISPGPAGQEVDIRFTYDLNGVLEVEATVVKTQKKANLVIQSRNNQLSESELQKALEHMKDIKVHPRDEAKNRFVLRKAERAFKELDQHSKNELTFVLDAFESAIESQDRDLSEQMRQEVEKVLKKFNVDFDENFDS